MHATFSDIIVQQFHSHWETSLCYWFAVHSVYLVHAKCINLHLFPHNFDNLLWLTQNFPPKLSYIGLHISLKFVTDMQTFRISSINKR